MRNFNPKKNSGFTLVEILVSVAIFALVIVGIGVFQGELFVLSTAIDSGLTGQAEAKKLLRPFANEARGASTSNLGGYPIETNSSSTLTFYSDTDDDGLRERLRYFLDSDGIFKKGITVPTGNPLVYNTSNEEIVQVVRNVVNTDIFTYYDTTYVGTTTDTSLPQPVTSSDIRLVQVELVVDEDVNKPPAASTIKTQVTFRNLKSNF